MGALEVVSTIAEVVEAIVVDCGVVMLGDEEGEEEEAGVVDCNVVVVVVVADGVVVLGGTFVIASCTVILPIIMPQ